LNAVTVDDLVPLAEQSKSVSAVPEVPTVTPTPEAPVTPAPVPAQTPGGNIGTLFIVAAVVVLGGGAGWYFKIYRPKHQAGAVEETEYAPEDEAELDGWDETEDE
jgi:hypothetical protein